MARFSVDDNNLMEPLPSLDAAYLSLLESRETLFNSNEVPEISDEDKICNQNLQISYLFKTLKDRYTLLNRQIEALVDNEKSLEETVIKFKNTNLTLTNLCMIHDNDSIETLQKKYLDLSTDMSKIQITIVKEITIKKAGLESQLDDISAKLNAIRKIVIMGVEDMVKPEDLNKKMCPVCFEREVCMVMIPCGHTYCDECSKYDYRAKCPQCRATINSRVKMYFSI